MSRSKASSSRATRNSRRILVSRLASSRVTPRAARALRSAGPTPIVDRRTFPPGSDLWRGSIGSGPTGRRASSGGAERPILEVSAALEVGRDLGSGELVQSHPVPSGRPEGTAGSVRDVEGADRLPSSGLELDERGRKVVHPIDEDRPMALDVVRQQEERRAAGQPDRGDPGPTG